MVDGFENRNSPSWDIGRRCIEPLVQVREEEDEVVVTADLPYVGKDDIEIAVKKKSLVLKAEMKRDIRFESWGGVHRKVDFNSFRKTIPLPSAVNPDEAEAEFRSGVLKVRLGKERGRNIEIE